MHDELMVIIRGRLAPGPGSCLDWTGTKSAGKHGTHGGYGQLGTSGKRRYVHRIVLEHKLGRALGPWEQAQHTCDRPSCVNPDHLKPGSPKENMVDCVKRGRHRGGQRRWGREDLSTDVGIDDFVSSLGE